MPSLGADMEAGTLVEWLVKPGDRVKRGDVVAVVETQKGAIEIEIFETGLVEQILVDLGATVPVGSPLARIRADTEAAATPQPVAPKAVAPRPAPKVAPTAAPRPPPRAKTAPPPAAAPATTREAGRLRASPAARRLAESLKISLADIAGSGPGGAIVRADVEGAPTLGNKPARRAVGLDPAAMRAAIAAAMARSKRDIPHYYLAHQIDMTACQQWLARTNAQRPPDSRLLMGALAIKAVALSAGKFSGFNGFVRDGNYERRPPSTSAWRSPFAAAASSRRRSTMSHTSASMT